MTFVRGAKNASVSANQFQYLSDMEKRSMCMDLLNEFGAVKVIERDDELIHSCCLPFGLHAHGDAKPSASLNWRKLSYNCLGCGNGGGLFWFISVCRGETEGEVQDWANTKISYENKESVVSIVSYLESLYNPQREGPPPPIPHFNPLVLEPWRKIHPYLTETRHIPVENIVKHMVGYDEKLDRIVFPLWWEEKLVGWQTRRIWNDDKSPKYKCSPDFPRDRVLYNYQSKLDLGVMPVIVESPMTVVSKTHLDGFHFMATFGAQVTKQQLRLIAEHERIILWYDNDQAGWSAIDNMTETLIKYSSVWVVDSPWNEDAGGLDDDTTRELLKGAVPYQAWTPPKEVKEW